VRGYPALFDEHSVDEGTAVGLRVFASEDEQLAQHRLAVRRLLVLNTAAPDLTEGLDNATKLMLAGSSYSSVKALLADCVLAALGDLAEPVWDEGAFTAVLDQARAELPARAAAIRDQVVRVLRDAMAVDRLLAGRVELAVLPSMNDMRTHLARLTAPGFVAGAGGSRLHDYPRYLAALTERHRRLAESSARDLELMGRIADFQTGYEQRLAALSPGRPPGENLVRLGWLVEEYRVSLWAQQLGTSEPVSDARLRTAMNQA
jgi:ATP-dependent helicase HrpA